LLVSLRPEHVISKVVQTLKANTSREFRLRSNPDAAMGERLPGPQRRVDQMTTLPDHVHLLVRTMPKMSVETCALALMNNAQHFIGLNYPGALIEQGLDRLWRDAAYVGTCGQMTTALLKAFLSSH